MKKTLKNLSPLELRSTLENIKRIQKKLYFQDEEGNKAILNWTTTLYVRVYSRLYDLKNRFPVIEENSEVSLELLEALDVPKTDLGYYEKLYDRAKKLIGTEKTVESQTYGVANFGKVVQVKKPDYISSDSYNMEAVTDKGYTYRVYV